MSELCTDNRFELIEKYKQKLIDGTNIEMAPDEMAVIDNILFRFWQMGWLDKLDADAVPVKHGEWLPKIVNDEYGDLNLFACSECDALSAQDNWKYCRNCGARMDGERKDDE